MMCAWNELIGILPLWMRQEVDQSGKADAQELRLRLKGPPELVLEGTSRWLEGTVTREDLCFVINTASRYSPWAASTSAQGYLTAPGGHRIGMCGETILRNGAADGFREVSSLCIRIARDFPGVAKAAAGCGGSVLILGAPGWGKTTLLRDLSRQLADTEQVCVIDERGELFPNGFRRGKRMDILSGCPKSQGILMALRTMGPDCITVDEITQTEDCNALIQAAHCGVRLLATAHGTSLREIRRRPIYRQLLEQSVFDTLLVLRKDKTYRGEALTG